MEQMEVWSSWPSGPPSWLERRTNGTSVQAEGKKRNWMSTVMENKGHNLLQSCMLAKCEVCGIFQYVKIIFGPPKTLITASIITQA